MLQEITLFKTKKEYFLSFFALLFIFTYAILIEYNNYTQLVRFDSHILTGTLLKQYEKTKLTKSGKVKKYQVLKLKNNKGFSFYTSAKVNQHLTIGQKIKLEVWAGKISFYKYMTSFYASSKILYIYKSSTLKEKLNTLIAKQHKNSDITYLYQALYTAKALPSQLQEKFSILGISHLLAISGFHLGVLATLLFFLFKFPYKFLQNRYFPYRSYKRDSFVFIALILFLYLMFLGSPPSLLRSFSMMLIAFFLYDRGFKILSMETLFLTVLILIAIFPRLFFTLGFWLSVSGVFYIFLFLIHFKHFSKLWQFLLIPFWVYLMMLPYSLVIFSNFSIYHPLSILWSSLFTLFYPLSILMHILTYGDILDQLLVQLLALHSHKHIIIIPFYSLIIEITLSLLSIRYRKVLYLLLLYVLSTFIHYL